jgi:nucleoid-associated protein EbfC
MNDKLIRQAQQLQAKLAKAQQELSEKTIEVTAGGGAITIVIDGKQLIHSVKIAAEVVNPEDVEMLQDMVMAAMNEAISKSQEMASDYLGGLTSGLKIPGF